MPPSSVPLEEKATVRRAIRAERRARAERTSAPGRNDLAATVRDHFAPVLDRLPRGAVVTSFVSWPSEPPTQALNAEIRRRGLDLILPVVLDDLDLDWRRPDADEQLGVEMVAEAALLVMPALAIAEDGMRLGQGGGCYDGVLPRVPRRTPRVALVFDNEFVERVPTEPHDRPVDAVVTPSHGLRTFSSWRETALGD